jgi:hypothetical protein
LNAAIEIEADGIDNALDARDLVAHLHAKKIEVLFHVFGAFLM